MSRYEFKDTSGHMMMFDVDMTTDGIYRIKLWDLTADDGRHSISAFLTRAQFNVLRGMLLEHGPDGFDWAKTVKVDWNEYKEEEERCQGTTQ